jgi:hypothetical protein
MPKKNIYIVQHIIDNHVESLETVTSKLTASKLFLNKVKEVVPNCPKTVSKDALDNGLLSFNNHSINYIQSTI